MDIHHLKETINKLEGPSKEQIVFYNQSASVALDKFHDNSEAVIIFDNQNNKEKMRLNWDSDFSKVAMVEKIDITNHGGVALAFFVMAVLLDYKYAIQSEIGDGVDYRFFKRVSEDDNLNFLSECHYIEVSAILKESKSNTLRRRLKAKHNQIAKGRKSNENSSVIVSVFSEPIVVKERHN